MKAYFRSSTARVLAELALIFILGTIVFYLANAGITLGTSNWLPLHEFDYQAFNISRENAVAWNNMLAAILGATMLLAFYGDWLNRKMMWQDFLTQTSIRGMANPWLITLLSILGPLLLLGAADFAQARMGAQDIHSAVSILVDGVWGRLVHLGCAYVCVRAYPCTIVREYFRITGKLKST